MNPIEGGPMNMVNAIGACCLGTVIGWLVRYFVGRFHSFTPKALASVVSVLLGGAVIGFLESDRSIWWFYPIGLLAGFLLYTLLALLFPGNKAIQNHKPE
jgi:hypothetical protein